MTYLGARRPRDGPRGLTEAQKTVPKTAPQGPESAQERSEMPKRVSRRPKGPQETARESREPDKRPQ
eukprot:5681191-Pyramimonas_sp.AAC.1